MTKKRGGFRVNSGRKKKNANDKMISKTICFPNKIVKEVNNVSMPHCKSFSAKVNNLIIEGIKSMKNNEKK